MYTRSGGTPSRAVRTAGPEPLKPGVFSISVGAMLVKRMSIEKKVLDIAPLDDSPLAFLRPGKNCRQSISCSSASMTL